MRSTRPHGKAVGASMLTPVRASQLVRCRADPTCDRAGSSGAGDKSEREFREGDCGVGVSDQVMGESGDLDACSDAVAMEVGGESISDAVGGQAWVGGEADGERGRRVGGGAKLAEIAVGTEVRSGTVEPDGSYGRVERSDGQRVDKAIAGEGVDGISGLGTVEGDHQVVVGPFHRDG